MGDDVSIAKNRGLDSLPIPIDHDQAPTFQVSHPIIRYRAKRLSFPAHSGLILCSLLLAGLIPLTYLASQNPYLPGDVGITHAIQSITFPPFEFAMYAVSVPGAKTLALTGILLCFIALWFSRYRLEALFIALIPVFDLSHSFLNLLTNRPIPSSNLVHVYEMSDWLGITPGSDIHSLLFWGGTRSLSFPSGHVIHFTLLFGFLLYLISTHRKPGFSRTALQFLLIGLILASGLSRIYLGMHWFSDILGSYLVGLLLLALLIAVYKKIRYWLGVCPSNSSQPADNDNKCL